MEEYQCSYSWRISPHRGKFSTSSLTMENLEYMHIESEIHGNFHANLEFFGEFHGNLTTSWVKFILSLLYFFGFPLFKEAYECNEYKNENITDNTDQFTNCVLE